MFVAIMVVTILKTLQSDLETSENHKFNVLVHEIVCADFLNTLSECCDQLDESSCQSKCDGKLIFKMGSKQFEHFIALPHNSEDERINKSFDFSETSFQIPTAVHIMLVDNATEFVIERWVMIYQLINSRQISLFQRGVHWKCKLNITFELLCSKSAGIGCKQKCKTTHDPTRQTCDHINGDVVCSILNYGTSCQSEYKGSKSIGAEGLIAYAFWMSLAVNSIAMIMIFLIRRYANLEVSTNSEIAYDLNSLGQNNNNWAKPYHYQQQNYKPSSARNSFE